MVGDYLSTVHLALFWNEADGRGIMASMLHGTKNASVG
jgi:hypothetical protein